MYYGLYLFPLFNLLFLPLRFILYLQAPGRAE
nr:MAG TPA: hypothetical protein [Caudoviricetes sp.]